MTFTRGGKHSKSTLLARFIANHLSDYVLLYDKWTSHKNNVFLNDQHLANCANSAKL